ncbi:MAG: 30S ribosomal protein S16 [Planctomycetota bacterium]
MVRIRLRRTGRKNLSFFRLVAIDSRKARDGRMLENLGSIDPRQKDEGKKCILKAERIVWWLSKGAKPTESAAAILKRHGIRKAVPVPSPAAPAKG